MFWKKTALAVAVAAVAVGSAPVAAGAAAGPGPAGRALGSVTPGFGGPDSGGPGSEVTGSQVTVDLKLLDRNGQRPATDDADVVVFVEPTSEESVDVPIRDGVAQAQVPPGRYYVSTFIRTAEPDGEPSITLVARPGVRIRKATSLTLDARAGKPLAVTTDRADARMTSGTAVVAAPVAGKLTLMNLMPIKGGYVTPTRRAAGLVMYQSAVLAKDGVVDGSPYIYNVVHAFRGAIPRDPRVRVRTAELAEVRTRYAGLGRPSCADGSAGARWPVDPSISYPTGGGPLPATRTEYYTPGLEWVIDYTAAECGTGGGQTQFVTEHFPRAGRYERVRNAGPFGPALAQWNQRHGDELRIYGISMYAVSASRQGGSFGPGTTTTATLSRNGEVLATGDDPDNLSATVGPERATYRVDVDTERDVPWADLSTRQHATWKFSSEHVESARLPLLVVRYRMRLDEQNRARAGATHRFEVRLERPGGTVASDALPPVLQASFDDGATWRPVPLAADGDHWIATLRHPTDAGHVSLRASARDRAGNSVDQTLIRAYGLKS